MRERKGKNKKHFLKNKKIIFNFDILFFCLGFGVRFGGCFFGVGCVGWFDLFEGFEIVGMVQDLREWESVEGAGVLCVWVVCNQTAPN